MTLDDRKEASMAKPAPTVSTQIPSFIVPLGRGGRGKTWWIRWVVERAQSQGREIVVADADRTNATLSAYFEGVVSPPSADDRDVREWLAAFVEQQIESRFTSVLDFGGGDLILKRVAREIGLVDFLLEHGIRPIAVHLIGPDRDDLAYLQEVERDGVFAPEATILVLNEALVSPHKTAATAFAETVRSHPILEQTVARGARLVTMPRLEPASEIDMRRLTFAAAEAGRVKPGQDPIGPWKRQQIALWRRSMEEAFAPVADWLP
ncbi:hypothetical protein HN018_27390 (plasmid) [Lichenicola cladoniae]|uniref:Uncharacterized protein n=1 Tax=Lichenicola cladoniae TaxID=1484109 RepID=A0A6M8HZP2_9PROT|nr:hypothetical protein [Lichenicola cladoniae]NPD69995.1 hypothetical protein [Acetobacteraceae bacterium]QKE93862.1 hypothetical protein HN018_27390 [Lichenicola cladoniae]